ncbi:MAG: MFS transporter [Chloroflexota bacterium]|nr:MFS transporter [Chloroflexota bacterium]
MPSTLPRPGYRYLLANRAFGLLWLGQAVSTLGDAVYDVALLWYVLDLTGSALAAAGIAVGATAGRLAGSLTAGAVLDRVHTRTVMLSADLARVALTLLVSVAWLIGAVPPLWGLYGLAAGVAFGTAFFNPARAASVPQVVPREFILDANALDAVSHGIVVTSAWALSGVVVAALGPALSLLLDASTFGVSYLLVRAARWERERPAERAVANPLAEALGGVRWARGDSVARTVLGAEALHALAAGFFVSALAAYIKELGGGATLYGLQGGAFGVGLILSSSLISYRTTRRVGRLYSGGVLLNGLGNTLFGLVPAAYWLLPTVFFAGLGAPAWGAGRQSILQTHAPAVVRGRVFALLDTLGTMMVMPAFVIGGWVADHLGAREVVVGASLIHVGLGLYLWSAARVRDFTVAGNGV